MLPGAKPPSRPKGMAPVRILFLSFMAAACFLGGYSVGRNSGLSTCAASLQLLSANAAAPRVLSLPEAASAPCPAQEPCVCDCLGNPDRKLIDPGPKKPFALPFSVGKDYQHVDAAFGGGDNQHRGGDGGKIPDAPIKAGSDSSKSEDAFGAPPPKPLAEDSKPPLFLAAMFKKEHGGGGGSEGAAAAAPAAAAAAAGEGGGGKAVDKTTHTPPFSLAASSSSSSSSSPLVSALGTPTAGNLVDQCQLPPTYRGLMEAGVWLERPVVDVRFFIKAGVHAAEHVFLPAKAYSTLYPGSRTSLLGNDVWALMGKNEWDPLCWKALRAVLRQRPGSGVIDVGAWIGATSMYAAAIGAGKVLAIEPDPLAFEELWANTRLNPDFAAKTWVYRHCASDRVEKKSITSIPGSTEYALGAWDNARPEKPTTWSVDCSSIPALAEAHDMKPETVGFLRINAQPGMELYIAKTVQDWGASTPAGKPKPGIWFNFHLLKWGDKTLGHHAIIPLVKSYKYQYDTFLEPVDMALVDRKGEGPCPKEHNLCSLFLSDIPLTAADLKE